MSVNTRFVGALVACTLGLLASAPASALAITESPQWTVMAVSGPTNFKPGDHTGEDVYVVTLTNTGGASSDGSPVQVTDELPPGLSRDPKGASGENPLARTSAGFSCELATCTYSGVVVPDQSLVVTFPVDVATPGVGPADAYSDTCETPARAAGCLTNVVQVSGGGAPGASMRTPTAISTEPAAFGISPGGSTTALSSVQAGAHPDLTTSIAFNTVNAESTGQGTVGSLAGDTKDTIDELPPGFAGDLVDTPTCSAALFSAEGCPVASQIGITTVTLKFIGAGTNGGAQIEPVYNLAPDPGEVAKLGFVVDALVHVEGGVHLRGDYGLRTDFENINQGATELDSVSLTVWGVPADPSHDPLRAGGASSRGVSSDAAPRPFFTNPTSCGGQLQAGFIVNSWQEPQHTVSAQMSFGPIVGCDRLGMDPSLTAEATTSSAYAPTGFDLGMTIPQTYENPAGISTAMLKREVVTLPEGMTVNPSAGAGLGACTEAQYGEEAAQYVPGNGCPNNSKLGTVKIHTPVLNEEVNGSVYLAQQYDNPFGSLLALYIVARIPDRGIIVKAAGEVTADPLTGRLVTTFDDLPPLPFDFLKFRFNQGQTSPLVTPPGCGSYTVEAALTPYSQPSEVLTPLIPPFPITSAFDGGACPTSGVPPFAPKAIAGTQDNNAGSYSPMYLRLVRGDGEQEITGFASQLPPGLTANLSGVPFCSDAAIALARTKTGAQEEAEPSCPAASQIGHTLVGAGVGSVLAQAPGKIYMAGPFQGAAFSVVSITSAKVGPFDLGTVVVRLPLQIDPVTAAVSIPAGPSDQIPHILKGIVIHVRDIRVYIDTKPNFTLNPTNCEHQTFSATVIGSGANFTSAADDVPVTVTNPFQAADCQALKFKPSFKVSTSGRTSRKNGASLSVKLTYPKAPQGTQANIRSVKVDLPKQLPSNLPTLNRACLVATFNANPAACPSASRVGTAKAITPILPVPLEGPAYFVSYGGAKFPELIIVLQGYGVTIDLHGETFISKAGITSSTFRSVPDEPVTSFELTLPQGQYPALHANTNLCGITKTVMVKRKVKVRSKGHARTVTRKARKRVAGSLVMPTAFTAQNGMVIHQNTPIEVTGCGKTKKKAKAVRHAGRAPKRRRK